MRASEIEAAMWEFYHRNADVLVASTIIESGLDIPSVNTLLVEDAQDFGLAQLYQLRGRIGRERQRAACYLFFPAGAEELSALTEEARKRLEALREFGELGAGVKLAMRDLEIRGCGELLGARQHGFINAVGSEMYAELLSAELASRRGRPEAPKGAEAALDLDVDAFIPESYLPGELERLDYYKRILRADAEGARALRRELEDLCGPLPEPVRLLFRVLEVRALAARVRVRRATQKGGVLEIVFGPGADISGETMGGWLRTYAGRLRFAKRPDGEGVEVELRGESPLAWLEAFLRPLVGGAAEK